MRRIIYAAATTQSIASTLLKRAKSATGGDWDLVRHRDEQGRPVTRGFLELLSEEAKTLTLTGFLDILSEEVKALTLTDRATAEVVWRQLERVAWPRGTWSIRFDRDGKLLEQAVRERRAVFQRRQEAVLRMGCLVGVCKQDGLQLKKRLMEGKSYLLKLDCDPVEAAAAVAIQAEGHCLRALALSVLMEGSTTPEATPPDLVAMMPWVRSLQSIRTVLREARPFSSPGEVRHILECEFGVQSENELLRGQASHEELYTAAIQPEGSRDLLDAGYVVKAGEEVFTVNWTKFQPPLGQASKRLRKELEHAKDGKRCIKLLWLLALTAAVPVALGGERAWQLARVCGGLVRLLLAGPYDLSTSHGIVFAIVYMMKGTVAVVAFCFLLREMNVGDAATMFEKTLLRRPRLP